MSDSKPQRVRGFEVVQERDVVASRKVIVTLLVAIVVTIVSTAVAAMILSMRRASLSFHEPPSASAAPREIDNIHQTLIARERHGLELREKQRRALEEYRYLDRSRGLAQIPIDRAMQIVVENPAASRLPGGSP